MDSKVGELVRVYGEKLIDKVMVHGDRRIEVVWKFEDNVDIFNIG